MLNTALSTLDIEIHAIILWDRNDYYATNENIEEDSA